MKKGLMQLTIEIDYDEMLTEENLKGIQAFTGKKDADEIMQLHMSDLGKKLVEVVKDMPLLRYQLEGRFVPVNQQSEATPQQEQVQAEVGEEVKGEQDIDLVAYLDQDLETVSIEHGIPQLIKINDKMKEALESHAEYLSNSETKNSHISKYKGFDVVVEGMEEHYEIVYKPYNNSNETRSFSRKIV
jgi:hypothetical protein